VSVSGSAYRATIELESLDDALALAARMSRQRAA
jgi:hypothetical protein